MVAYATIKLRLQSFLFGGRVLRMDADPKYIDAWGYILRLQSLVVARIEEDLKRKGEISLTWYDVLLALDNAPGKRLRMSELAENCPEPQCAYAVGGQAGSRGLSEAGAMPRRRARGLRCPFEEGRARAGAGPAGLLVRDKEVFRGRSDRPRHLKPRGHS